MAQPAVPGQAILDPPRNFLALSEFNPIKRPCLWDPPEAAGNSEHRKFGNSEFWNSEIWKF
eukprot:4755138-Alexandrium_andersonii.AAC.1